MIKGKIINTPTETAQQKGTTSLSQGETFSGLDVPRNRDNKMLRKARSEALKDYFSSEKFDFIKRAPGRGGKIDALILYASPKLLLEKERARGGDDEEIAERLEVDLIDVSEQYRQLLDLLPGWACSTLPLFAEEEWTDIEHQRFVENSFFASAIDANQFIARESNLSQIAKQIKTALGLLRAQMASKIAERKVA